MQKISAEEQKKYKNMKIARVVPIKISAEKEHLTIEQLKEHLAIEQLKEHLTTEQLKAHLVKKLRMESPFGKTILNL